MSSFCRNHHGYQDEPEQEKRLSIKINLSKSRPNKSSGVLESSVEKTHISVTKFASQVTGTSRTRLQSGTHDGAHNTQHFLNTIDCKKEKKKKGF